MAKQYEHINADIRDFIGAQKIFFVATAAAQGKINLSPKGMDSLRVLDDKRVIWLNLTGSGNETAAHVEASPRMTMMFCSFDKQPMILRLYGEARAVHQNDADWAELYPHFPPALGARQIFDMRVDLVQTSCGFAVPFYDYVGERDTLSQWSEKKGEQGVREYWQEKNVTSLDGLPTHIVEKNLAASD